MMNQNYNTKGKIIKGPPTNPGGYLEFNSGMPVLQYNPPPDGMICKSGLVKMFYDVLSRPYTGQIYDPVTQMYIQDPRPEMIGRSNAEVMLENTVNGALMGDFEKTKFLIEHTKGRPVQENNNVNIDATQTYKELLEQWAKEEDEVEFGVPSVIDVTPETSSFDDEYDYLLEDL